MESTPVRRRLDLRALRPAGGGDEFLVLRLVDDSGGDTIEAQDDCTLPAPDAVLGDRGITVEQFLRHWRQGEAWLDAEARHYGRLLYRHLFEQSSRIRDDWALAVQSASGCGLRLDIRFPEPDAAHWRGQSLTALPFELLCDDRGFLFRRPGWSAVRRPSRQRSRPTPAKKSPPPISPSTCAAGRSIWPCCGAVTALAASVRWKPAWPKRCSTRRSATWPPYWRRLLRWKPRRWPSYRPNSSTPGRPAPTAIWKSRWRGRAAAWTSAA